MRAMLLAILLFAVAAAALALYIYAAEAPSRQVGHPVYSAIGTMVISIVALVILAGVICLLIDVIEYSLTR